MISYKLRVAIQQTERLLKELWELLEIQKVLETREVQEVRELLEASALCSSTRDEYRCALTEQLEHTPLDDTLNRLIHVLEQIEIELRISTTFTICMEGNSREL